MSCPSRSVQVDKPQVSYFRVTLSELYTCGVAVPRSLYQVHRNQRGRSRLGACVRVTATRTRVLGCAASRGGCIKAAAAETPDAQQAAFAAYCNAMQLYATEPAWSRRGGWVNKLLLATLCNLLQLIRAYCSTYATDTRRGGGLTRTQGNTKQAVL